MRRYSLKRQKKEREAQPWRKQFREEIGKCDACQTTERLSIHEIGIARGANREKCLMETSCLLVLCLASPATGYEGCHDLWDKRTEEEQLALLFFRRPWHFDLEKYKFLTRPTAMNRLSLTDINHAHAALWAGINARTGERA